MKTLGLALAAFASIFGFAAYDSYIGTCHIEQHMLMTGDYALFNTCRGGFTGWETDQTFIRSTGAFGISGYPDE